MSLCWATLGALGLAELFVGLVPCLEVVTLAVDSSSGVAFAAFGSGVRPACYLGLSNHSSLVDCPFTAVSFADGACSY